MGIRDRRRRAAATPTSAWAISPPRVGWPASVASRAEIRPDHSDLLSDYPKIGQQVHAGAHDERQSRQLSCHRVTSLPVLWCNVKGSALDRVAHGKCKELAMPTPGHTAHAVASEQWRRIRCVGS